jgi:predicted MFS family arabinose efflux permease
MTDRVFVLVLFVMAFLVQADHLVMVPLGADIAKATGVSMTRAAMLVSVYPIAAALSAFFFAPFSDRYGRKNMLIFLVGGFCLASLGCALADSQLSIFVFRILSGVFGGIIIPNALAFVSDVYSGKQKIKGLTTITLSLPIASVLGVPLGAWIGDAFSWRIPFVMIALLSFVCVIFIFLSTAVEGTKAKPVMQQYKELLLLWRHREARLLFAIQFFMLIGLFGFVPNLSIWLTINFNMSTTEIGLCYMQGGVGAILGNFAARHLLQRPSFQPAFQQIVEQKNMPVVDRRTSLISVGSVMMGLVLLAVTLAVIDPVYIGLAFAVSMFGGSLRMPALQLILSELVDVTMRGRLLSMNMIVASISMGLGGILSLPLLSVEAGHLYGMDLIGWLSFTTLCFVPFLVRRLSTASLT